jgi:phosphohistidine phosphatase SixA
VGSKQPTHGEDHQEEDREIDGGEKHGEVSQMAKWMEKRTVDRAVSSRKSRAETTAVPLKFPDMWAL